MSVSERGLAHAGQAVAGECRRTCLSWSHNSHMRGVPGLVSVVIEHGQIVDARVYLVCSWAGVERGFATEC